MSDVTSSSDSEESLEQTLASLRLMHPYRDDFTRFVPPPGVKYVETPSGFRIVVSTRSWAMLALTPGIVAIVAVLSYVIFGIAQEIWDSWRPLPDITELEYGFHMLLFAGLLAGCLISISELIRWWLNIAWGKLVVELAEQEGLVVRGVGSFGRRDRFPWTELIAVDYNSDSSARELCLFFLGDRFPIPLGRDHSAKTNTYLQTTLSQIITEQQIEEQLNIAKQYHEQLIATQQSAAQQPD